MIRRRFGKRRGRLLWVLLFYLLIVVGGAVALWLLIPEEVKKTIYDTYFKRP